MFVKYASSHPRILASIIIVLFVFINSCQKEDLLISNLEQDANASNPIKLIKRVFNNDKFGDTFLLENGKVMWNSSRIQQTDSTQLFEFDILINEKKAIINEFYADTIHYSLLANLDKKQNVQLHVLEWIPTRANKYSKPDYVNKNSFSGLLNMYSLDGQLIEAAFYKAGNQKSKLPNLQIKERRDQIMEEKLVLKAPPIGGCDCWVAVWADNYTYWYQTVGSGSSSITTYLGTEFTGRTLIYVYMPSDGGGGNGYYEQTETQTLFECVFWQWGSMGESNKMADPLPPH